MACSWASGPTTTSGPRPRYACKSKAPSWTFFDNAATGSPSVSAVMDDHLGAAGAEGDWELIDAVSPVMTEVPAAGFATWPANSRRRGLRHRSPSRWKFTGPHGDGCALEARYGRPMHRFLANTDDPNDDIETADFLRDRIWAYCQEVIAHVRQFHPTAVFKCLWPLDAN